MITIAFQVLFVLVVFMIAYTQGYNDGVKVGRRAVRKFYEQLDKVRV
jgi:hypothetical protein